MTFHKDVLVRDITRSQNNTITRTRK